MARFNGSTSQQGGQSGPPQAEAPAWTAEQLAQWHQQQAQLQQQAYQPHGHAPQPAAPAGPTGWRQPGQGQPYASPTAPTAHPHGGGHDAHAQHGWQQHAPAPGRPGFADTGQQQGWGTAAPAHAQPAPQAHAGWSAEQQSLAQIIEATRQQAAANPQAAYELPPVYGDRRWPEPHPAQPHGYAQHDSQSSWDLANYPPAHHHPAAHGQVGHGLPAGYGHDQTMHGGHYQHGAAEQGWGGGVPGAPHGGPYAAHDPMRADGLVAAYGFDAHGNPLQGSDQAQYADHAEEPQERRRSPNVALVAGALVGAIVLGGGLAYGYRMLTGGGGSAKTAVVKADQSPAKSRPDKPGGKDVAHTDKKFLNQLTDNGQPPARGPSQPADQAASGEGPRRVTTLTVRPDGSVTPPAAVPPPAVSSGIPGMVIDGGPRPAAPRPAEASTAAPPFVAAAPPAPSRAPEIVNPAPPAKAEPASRPAEPPPRLRGSEQQARVDPAPPAETPAKKPAVNKKASARDDAASATTGATSSRVTTSSGSGFVTVLASRKSQGEALSMFPDLQSKYAEVLAGKTPDVRETDLTAQGKGIVYRLIVGPPGSKEAAIDTCNKLKAAGFNGCWATPF